MTDARDLIKKCPHCSLIWMKTVGCPNLYCGTQVGAKDYLKSKLRRHTFQIQGGRISFTKENARDPNRNERAYEVKRNDIKQGCSKSFNWNSAPRLPNIEEILKELFGVSNFE
jgi:hypothetical protein